MGTPSSDLEYAKKRKDLTSHEMRTASEPPITLSGKSLIASQQGTMDFMSIEVAAQEFLFPHVEEPTLTEHEGTVPFSHNHLHDLESLWWVAAWVVFTTISQQKGRSLPHFNMRINSLIKPKLYSLPCQGLILAFRDSELPGRSRKHATGCYQKTRSSS
jgi:hypothetical protein